MYKRQGLIDSKEGKVIDDVGLGKELKDYSICEILSEIYNLTKKGLVKE